MHEACVWILVHSSWKSVGKSRVMAPLIISVLCNKSSGVCPPMYGECSIYQMVVYRGFLRAVSWYFYEHELVQQHFLIRGLTFNCIALSVFHLCLDLVVCLFFSSKRKVLCMCWGHGVFVFMIVLFGLRKHLKLGIYLLCNWYYCASERSTWYLIIWRGGGGLSGAYYFWHVYVRLHLIPYGEVCEWGWGGTHLPYHTRISCWSGWSAVWLFNLFPLDVHTFLFLTLEV